MADEYVKPWSNCPESDNGEHSFNYMNHKRIVTGKYVIYIFECRHCGGKAEFYTLTGEEKDKARPLDTAPDKEKEDVLTDVMRKMRNLEVVELNRDYMLLRQILKRYDALEEMEERFPENPEAPSYETPEMEL